MKPNPIPDQVLTPISVQDARLVVYEAAGYGGPMGPSVDALVEAVEAAIRARLEAICNDAIEMIEGDAQSAHEQGSHLVGASKESVARHLRQRLAALAGVPKEAPVEAAEIEKVRDLIANGTPDELALYAAGGEERVNLQAAVDARRAQWKRAANEHARRMSASSLDSVEGSLARLQAAEAALAEFDGVVAAPVEDAK